MRIAAVVVEDLVGLASTSVEFLSAVVSCGEGFLPAIVPVGGMLVAALFADLDLELLLGTKAGSVAVSTGTKLGLITFK